MNIDAEAFIDPDLERILGTFQYMRTREKAGTHPQFPVYREAKVGPCAQREAKELAPKERSSQKTGTILGISPWEGVSRPPVTMPECPNPGAGFPPRFTPATFPLCAMPL